MHLDRRDFIRSAIAVASGTMAPLASAATVRGAKATAFALEDQQPFKAQTRRLKITDGGKPVASLIFPTDYPTHFRLKPELHQVCTPKGIPVTGSHEFSFIHHQSIMCGHGKVQVDGDKRVVDFYRQLPFPDLARTDKWHAADHNLYNLGPSGLQRITKASWRVADQIVIRLELAWETREPGRDSGGDTLLTEERFYRFGRQSGATTIDVFSKLQPAGRAATLIPENDHGYIGVRVHDLIDVEDGGVMRDSEGRNAEGYFRVASREWRTKTYTAADRVASDAPAAGQEKRRAPHWVDCTGKIGDATVGIALMSHPSNPCNEWYVRDFGLMIVSAAQSAPVRITAERPFEFAARFVAHDEALSPPVADALYREFASATAEQVRSFLKS